MENKRNIISVRLNDEQYRFLTEWQNKMESETGVEIPIGALIRKILDRAIKGEADHPHAEASAAGEEPRKTWGFVKK